MTPPLRSCVPLLIALTLCVKLIDLSLGEEAHGNLPLEVASLPFQQLNDEDRAGSQWKQRLLILFAPDGYRPELEQLSWWRHPEVQAGLIERRLRLLRSSATPVAGIQIDRVELVGLDGLTKRTWPTLPHPAEVFAIIDAMPMRVQEREASLPSEKD